MSRHCDIPKHQDIRQELSLRHENANDIASDIGQETSCLEKKNWKGDIVGKV